MIVIDAELPQPMSESRQLEAMNRVASAVAGSLGLDDVLSTAVESLLDVTGLSSGVVYFISDGGDHLVGRNYSGFDFGFEHKLRVHKLRNQSLPSRAFRTSEPLIFDVDDDERGMASITAAERRAIEPEGIRAAVACRLESSARVYGVLVLSSHRCVRKFAATELSFIKTVCGQVGVAIERASLHDDVEERMREATTFYEIGRKLVSRIDTERVLAEVLECYRAGFGITEYELVLHEPIGGQFRFGPADPTHTGPGRSGPSLDDADGSVAFDTPVEFASERIGTLFARAPATVERREQRRLRSLADLVAMAIRNRHLHDERVLLGVTEERNRIARDIHDSLTQLFYSIQLHLEAAQRASADDAAQQQRHLNDALALTKSGLDEARRSVGKLRASALENRTLVQALRTLASDISRDADLSCTVECTGAEVALDADAEESIFRAVQECVNNVMRHAEADHIEVAATFAASEVIVAVSDDGVGFDNRRRRRQVGRRAGWGLVGLDERLALLGGSVAIESRRRRGTTVTLSVPTAPARALGD